jgi:hypothetical protein
MVQLFGIVFKQRVHAAGERSFDIILTDFQANYSRLYIHEDFYSDFLLDYLGKSN